MRIKDIADVEGVRDNQLIGYGLVVGLNGTGDKLNNNIFTRESLVGMLERLGVNTRDQIAKLSTKNVAAVMVTAELPRLRPQRQPDRRHRRRPRRRHQPDRRHPAGHAPARRRRRGLRRRPGRARHRRHRRARRCVLGDAAACRPPARIANGATVEREVAFQLDKATSLRLGLRNPDLTTARRIAAAINAALGPISRATDPRTVAIDFGGRDPIDTLAAIEDLRVEPDSPAIVVIEEASGTIVMGANVRISTVAIAQGNLTIRVTETPQVSQPGPLSNGTTVTVPRTQIQIDDQHDKKLGILSSGVTLRDLVASLNALGVGPRDLISILQSIKAAGALQADLEVR